MDDIAQAALGKQIERKSDIIHSLPETTDDASSGEQETKVESEDVAGKQKSGAALKNLFSALADGQGRVAASAKEGNLKEKSQSLKTDNQVSRITALHRISISLSILPIYNKRAKYKLRNQIRRKKNYQHG